MFALDAAKTTQKPAFFLLKAKHVAKYSVFFWCFWSKICDLEQQQQEQENMTPCKLGAGGPCRGTAWISKRRILCRRNIVWLVLFACFQAHFRSYFSGPHLTWQVLLVQAGIKTGEASAMFSKSSSSLSQELFNCALLFLFLYFALYFLVSSM